MMILTISFMCPLVLWSHAGQEPSPYLNLRAGQGLSDYGKETMLRVMARVQRLRTVDATFYTKVSTMNEGVAPRSLIVQTIRNYTLPLLCTNIAVQATSLAFR